MTDDAEILDFYEQLRSLANALSSWLPELGGAFAKAFPPGSGGLLVLALMVVVGLVGERLACRKLNALKRSMQDQQCESFGMVLGYALFGIVFDLAGVMLFGIFGWVVMYISVAGGTPVFLSLQAVLWAIVVFRASAVVVRAILAPSAEGIRPLALDNADAATIYRWVVAFIAFYTASGAFLGRVVTGMETPVLARSTISVGGFLLTAILIAFVWANRKRLARLFADDRSSESPAMLRQLLSKSWPYMATVWLLLLWGNWAYANFTNDAEHVSSTLVSWWITLLFPAADRLIHAALKKLSHLKLLRDTGFEKRRTRFVSLVQTCVRGILIVVAVMALGITWNFTGTGILRTEWGQRVIWAAVDIGITILIAYILYEIVMSLLDKHMPGESAGVADLEGEMGGAGATRQETLAPLLRTVFLVLLLVVVVLAVLSTLGVQILPLLAGASILGLAIGFGAQKLVQDIISGVFFLIDDAFRRGEYIDLGSVKGSVEKISVRSMQLRHHNGALHTIPFGEIRHLTNYSRDWVMMKLKLRLTYDTDVERVRKLIKKLGERLLEDEELGPLFLQPLKSQGVYSMEDDSAMIMRVKFMTRPGDQFMVRKKVYTDIQELFAREGIEFAHRVVSVRVDTAEGVQLSDADKKRVAGAALSTPQQ